MNNIFIWVGYGIVDVYDVSSLEKLKELFIKIRDSLEFYQYEELEYLDEQYSKLDQNCEETQRSLIVKLINNSLENMIGNLDSFDHGTGFSKLR